MTTLSELIAREGEIDASLVTAEEILKCAEEEFGEAIKAGDTALYRNSVDNTFLSIVVVNACISRR